jgi:hypothetical protein
VHYGELQQLLKIVEIMVAVQERVAPGQAKCGDQTVNCLADGPPTSSQCSEIFRGRNGKIFTAGFE